MARLEHLRLIQQGSSIWNTWREKNEEIIPHLICANLQGADLVGADEIDSRWAVELRHDREITDFRRWQNRDAYWEAVGRIVNQLKSGGRI